MGLTLIRIPAGEVEAVPDESGQGLQDHPYRKRFLAQRSRGDRGQFLEFLNDRTPRNPKAGQR